jgi:N-acetyl-anhydromuramyl-L-alanine amidase AmpD
MSSRKNMNYKFKTTPYKHQLTALKKSWDKKEYGYFMEMGTGKSKVLIDNMSMLYDKGKINGALDYSTKRRLHQLVVSRNTKSFS